MSIATKLFSNLSRDMIYAFEKQGLIAPTKRLRGQKLQGRFFSFRDLKRLGAIDRSYGLKFSPEYARDALDNPTLLCDHPLMGRTVHLIAGMADLMHTLLHSRENVMP